MDRLKRRASGGYLVVGEFSRAPVPKLVLGTTGAEGVETMRA